MFIALRASEFFHLAVLERFFGYYLYFMIDVKINFKKKYKDKLECRLCSFPEESQAHQFECNEIIIDEEVKSAIGSYSYEDIFSSDIKTQTHLIKTWQLIINVRKMKQKKATEETISN